MIIAAGPYAGATAAVLAKLPGGQLLVRATLPGLWPFPRVVTVYRHEISKPPPADPAPF
jgi:hypothetical protein